MYPLYELFLSNEGPLIMLKAATHRDLDRLEDLLKLNRGKTCKILHLTCFITVQLRSSSVDKDLEVLSSK